MTQLKEKLSTTPIAISPPLMILLPASSSSSSPPKATTEPIDKTPILDKTTTTIVQFLTLCLFSPQLLLPSQQLRIQYKAQDYEYRRSERAQVSELPSSNFREYARGYAPGTYRTRTFGNTLSDTHQVRTSRGLSGIRVSSSISISLRSYPIRIRSFRESARGHDQSPSTKTGLSGIRGHTTRYVASKELREYTVEYAPASRYRATTFGNTRERIRPRTYQARAFGSAHSDTSRYVPSEDLGEYAREYELCSRHQSGPPL